MGSREESFNRPDQSSLAHREKARLSRGSSGVHRTPDSNCLVPMRTKTRRLVWSMVRMTADTEIAHIGTGTTHRHSTE